MTGKGETSSKFQVGPIVVGLSGSDPILSYLREELAPLSVRNSRPVDIVFTFGTPNPRVNGRRVSGDLVFDDRALEYRSGRLVCQAEFHEWGINCRISRQPVDGVTGRLKRVAKSFLGMEYQADAARLAKNFIYGIFDQVTLIMLLTRGAVYAHSSVIENESRAVVFLAGGGVGKTTAMLSFCSHGPWRYLSDDLAVFSSDGTVFRSPKKIQVYKYNTIGNRELERNLLRGRSILDRFMWRLAVALKGVKGARRRISAEGLLTHEKVARLAKVETLIYLERADILEFEWFDMSPADAACRASFTLMDEIDPLPGIMNLTHSSFATSPISAPEVFRSDAQQIMRAAWKGCHAKRLVIPLSASPEELTDEIASYLRARQ